MRRNFSIFVLLVAALYMVACSETPRPQSVQANEASGPPVPVSGKTAFWAVYKSAYQWSKDAVPLKLESKTLPGIKNDAGSAAMWSGTFGSPSRREVIEISYAVAPQLPDISKGVNIGHAVPWSGPTRQVMPIQSSDIVADSDAAYKAAAAKADSWLKTHPDKPVSFVLGNNTTTFSTPVWYVLWGDKKEGYGAFVNTKTGEIAKGIK